ncbi:MAG: sugar kinase [Lachnospiraceae bacterium]
MSDIVTMGEILVRLSTINHNTFSQSGEFQVNYGGGEANVAVSLAGFGHNVRFVTKLPDNAIADCAINELYRMHVNTDYIIRGGERLGSYYLESGSSVRASRVIYDRKHSSISEAKPEEFDFDKIYDGIKWLHISGITAGISREGAELTESFAREARLRNIKISLDINYRGKLWSMEEAGKVMPSLAELADIAFAGPVDCIKILGCTDTIGDDTDKAMADKAVGEQVLRELAEKYNIRYVINSQRESISATHNIIGARIINGATGECVYSSRYDVDSIVDRVGGGDALAAGVLSSLAYDYEDFARAIEFGAAASAVKHTINGDYNIASRELVEELMVSGGNGLIKR